MKALKTKRSERTRITSVTLPHFVFIYFGMTNQYKLIQSRSKKELTKVLKSITLYTPKSEVIMQSKWKTPTSIAKHASYKW